MNADNIIQAMALPQDARVSHRVSKKLLLEQGAPTAADKRYIQDGIEELLWIAALKPTNIGVASYADESREYLEIAVLSTLFRPEAKVQRLIELIHRAIPYPVVLIVTHDEKQLTLSLAQKRYSQNESGKTVIDGDVVTILLSPITDIEKTFLGSFALTAQPAQNIFALYRSWIERIEMLAAARITGRFVQDTTPEHSSVRREALNERAQLERDLVLLRAQAAKEKQINRRVELNLSIKKLEARLKERLAQL